MRWLVGIIGSMDMSLSNHRELVISGQGSLVCCSPWGRKESDMNEGLNVTELNSFEGHKRIINQQKQLDAGSAGQGCHS